MIKQVTNSSVLLLPLKNGPFQPRGRRGGSVEEVGRLSGYRTSREAVDSAFIQKYKPAEILNNPLVDYK